jgi:hypothetical protein
MTRGDVDCSQIEDICRLPASELGINRLANIMMDVFNALDERPRLADIDRDDPAVTPGGDQSRQQMCTDEAGAAEYYHLSWIGHVREGSM